MLKLKILLLFIIFLSIPSYFILKEKSFNLPNLSKFTKTEKKDSHTEKSGEVTFKDKEIEEMVLKNSSSFLAELEVSFSIDKINIKGESKTPKQSFEGILLPKVVENKLKLEVLELKIGFVNSPEIFNNQIESVVNKSIDKNINKHHKIKSVIIRGNELVLIIK